MSVMTCLALALAAFAAHPKKKEDAIEHKIVGSWKVLSITVAGVPEKVVADAHDTFIFSANGRLRFSGKSDGSDGPESTFSLDAKMKPAAIDILQRNGKSTRQFKGVVKIEGNEMTICMVAGADATRPTDFQSPRDMLRILYVFRRDAKK